MGKSPAKWIKTVLFGKKSSKSNTSKGREKVANEKEVLVSIKASEADAALDPPLDSHPTQNTTQRDERKLIENKEAAEISDVGGVSLPGRQVAYSQNISPEDAPYDPEKIKQDKAATKAQAVFRGFLARRAFRALKGIIRLQALIRGHLARRQAVATLGAMLGIVKFQALVRGRKARHSDIGLDVGKKCNPVKLLQGKPVDPVGLNLSTHITKLSANAFISKLLASSPTVMPLYLQYDSEEPNSVSNWLERWSAFHFWKPASQPKAVSDSKAQKKHVNAQTLEAETGRPKRSVRRNPAAIADSIVQSTPEFEKSKRSLKKVSSHPADPVHENPQSELEKVKRSLRKVHNPVVENSASIPSEIEIEKPKHSLEKLPINSKGHEVLVRSMSNSGEKINEETILTPFKLPDLETTPEPVEVNKMSDVPGDQAADESKHLMESSGKDETTSIKNGEFDPNEDATNNENHKSSRKAAVPLPTKQEHAENGPQTSPSLPSYMAATESAKAKLRLQGSPRSSQDGAEKNNGPRRHSLPSSANSKISSQSPRTQRPVHTSGKNKGDKNHLSSREGTAKITQAEWRR